MLKRTSVLLDWIPVQSNTWNSVDSFYCPPIESVPVINFASLLFLEQTSNLPMTFIFGMETNNTSVLLVFVDLLDLFACWWEGMDELYRTISRHFWDQRKRAKQKRRRRKTLHVYLVLHLLYNITFCLRMLTLFCFVWLHCFEPWILQIMSKHYSVVTPVRYCLSSLWPHSTSCICCRKLPV